ncbi:MAG: mitochondrial splicing system protein [Thelocarpon superellum]|nr:MAG: mitochondrial splicing system protein [Thelocarpon superellum]
MSRPAVRTLHEPSVPPTADTILDSAALVLYFPAPNTVTGEEVLELHVHGGSATIKAVLAAIPRCTTSATGRIHYAEPGEFTRRAFFHNRLDVTQIEALGDSLAAETEQQRRLSVRGTSGALARQYEAWRHQLLQARGELEALIDFSEDQHFDETPTSLTSSVAMQVQALAAQIETFRANAMRGELRRNGLSISLLGAPNVGKSSLLNRIVGREAAIVSTEAGTTRDVIEIGVDIDGWYCRLADMAGIRRTLAKDRIEELAGSREIAPVGLVEHEGIQRAKERAAESDVVILMCSVEPDLDGQAFHLRVDADVLEAAAKINRRTGNVVAVVNKLDRVDDASTRMSKEWAPALMASVAHLSRKSIFGVSCKANVGPSEARADARGIQTLLAGLVEKFQEMTDPLLPTASGDQAVVPTDRSMWEASLGATERQRLLLDECLAHLQTFSTITRASSDQLGHSNDDLDVVVAAESLRAAASSLGKITGKGEAGDVEAVLGVVFEK